MKPSDKNGSRDAATVEAEAMAWLAERDEGFAPGRAAAFEAWRGRDPQHDAIAAELEEVLAHLDGLADRAIEVNARFDRVSPPHPILTSNPAPAPVAFGRWGRPVAWGGLAAALALGAIFGLRARQTTPTETRYVTSAAGYERARLEDGSTLELNTASAARVRFSAAVRAVELESGEAHFEVAHDAARPFVVSIAGITVRAVGTAFNIRLANGAVEVTVTEGKVSIEAAPVGSRPRDHRDHPEGDPAHGGLRYLNARQRLALPIASASADLSTSAIDQLAPADVRATLAWQRRVADFSDTPLAEAVARFNRHNAVQVVIADTAVGARRIGGMFALDDVEAFVRLLERDGIVRTEREGDTVRLLAP